MNEEIETSQHKELVLKELDRIKKLYQEEDVCWQELARSITVDPLLTMTEVVYLYGELSKELDGDSLVRVNKEDQEEPLEEYAILEEEVEEEMNEEEAFRNKVGNLTLRDFANFLKDPAVSEEEKKHTEEVLIDIVKTTKAMMEEKAKKE